MPPAKRNEDDEQRRGELTVAILEGIRDEVRDMASRVRKLEDIVLIITTKDKVRKGTSGAWWALAGAILVAIISALAQWSLKK